MAWLPSFKIRPWRKLGSNEVFVWNFVKVPWCSVLVQRGGFKFREIKMCGKSIWEFEYNISIEIEKQRVVIDMWESIIDNKKLVVI